MIFPLLLTLILFHAYDKYLYAAFIPYDGSSYWPHLLSSKKDKTKKNGLQLSWNSKETFSGMFTPLFFYIMKVYYDQGAVSHSKKTKGNKHHHNLVHFIHFLYSTTSQNEQICAWLGQNEHTPLCPITFENFLFFSWKQEHTHPSKQTIQ